MIYTVPAERIADLCDEVRVRVCEAFPDAWHVAVKPFDHNAQVGVLLAPRQVRRQVVRVPASDDAVQIAASAIAQLREKVAA